MIKNSLKIERHHPHMKECGDFADALKCGHIVVIEGEPQIRGKLPKDAEVGNILTGERYDPDRFALNMVIKYCPFCGRRLGE